MRELKFQITSIYPNTSTHCSTNGAIEMQGSYERPIYVISYSVYDPSGGSSLVYEYGTFDLNGIEGQLHNHYRKQKETQNELLLKYTNHSFKVNI